VGTIGRLVVGGDGRSREEYALGELHGQPELRFHCCGKGQEGLQNVLCVAKYVVVIVLAKDADARVAQPHLANDRLDDGLEDRCRLGHPLDHPLRVGYGQLGRVANLRSVPVYHLQIGGEPRVSASEIGHMVAVQRIEGVLEIGVQPDPVGMFPQERPN